MLFIVYDLLLVVILFNLLSKVIIQSKSSKTQFDVIWFYCWLGKWIVYSFQFRWFQRRNIEFIERQYSMTQNKFFKPNYRSWLCRVFFCRLEENMFVVVVTAWKLWPWIIYNASFKNSLNFLIINIDFLRKCSHSLIPLFILVKINQKWLILEFLLLT